MANIGDLMLVKFLCFCNLSESTEYFQAGKERNKGHFHLTCINKTVLGDCFFEIF